MDTRDLFAETFKRWEMLLAAWNFYLVVAFVLVGLVALSPRLRADRLALRLLAAGFAFFAWTHLLGLLYVLKQWAALAGMLRDKLPPAEVERLAMAGFVEAPEAVWVVPFHLLLDGFVLLAVWLLSRPAVDPGRPS
jgi:hypothetical protein